MKTALWIVLALAPSLAIAQVAPPDAEAENAPSDEAPIATLKDETPEARVERLFDALSKAEGDDADRIADELWATVDTFVDSSPSAHENGQQPETLKSRNLLPLNDF